MTTSEARQMNIIDAIESLTPSASWLHSAGTLSWLSVDTIQPTDLEISTEITRLQGIYDSQEYARNRKAKYDLLNQDELRFDDLENSTTTWQDAINAIKLEYPK